MRPSACAGLLGVSEVQAGLSPEQKLAAIQAAQQQGGGSAPTVRGSGVIMVSPGGPLPCAAASNTHRVDTSPRNVPHSAAGRPHGAGKDSQI